jgi:hypothetical protein
VSKVILKSTRLERIRSKLPKVLTIDKKQVAAAVKALKQLNAKKPKDLLDIGDDFVYIEVILTRVPEKHSIKPVQM